MPRQKARKKSRSLVGPSRLLAPYPVTALAVLLAVTITGMVVYRASHAATDLSALSPDQRTFADTSTITAARNQELALNQVEPPNSCQVFPDTQMCPGATVGSASASSDPTLVYHGGPVQHSPVLLVVEWGPNWATDTSVDPELRGLMGGLGVETGTSPDTWSTTVDQYGDANGAPSFRKGGGHIVVDTSTPPYGATQAQLAAEARAVAKLYVTPGNFMSTNIVVATQAGTCPAGFAGSVPPCPTGSAGYYCGWHNHTKITLNSTSYNLPYINLPWMGDTNGCPFSPSVAGDASVLLGHEFAEAITDPLLNAWTGGEGEIADACVGPGQGVNMTTGSYLEQPLYSNADQACVMSNGAQGGVVNQNGMCADDNASGLANGNKIDVWSCDHTGAQRLTYYGHQCYNNTCYGGDGSLRVLGRCLSVPSGGSGSGVVLNACAGTGAQNWSFDAATGAYKLKRNGLCLRDPGGSTTNGKQLDIYTCNGSANEHWSLPQG